MSDWYGISRNEVRKQGGYKFFKRYSSMEDVLRNMFPEHKWDPARFAEHRRAPIGYWNNQNNQREWLKKIGDQLGVKEVACYQLFRLSQSR